MHALHSPQEAARWLRQRVTGVLRTDSRQVQPGDGFIAWPGAVTDGRQYLDKALAQGAAACLMAAEGCELWQGLQPADRLAALPQLKALTGLVADAYYEQPSRRLDVLAVTGTNGKTSTAWWLAQALGSPVLQRTCALSHLVSIEPGLADQTHLPDRYCDLLVCNGVLIVLPDDASVRAALTEFARITKPGATVTREALLALSGDEGARRVMAQHTPWRLELDDIGCVLDVDTPQALADRIMQLDRTELLRVAGNAHACRQTDAVEHMIQACHEVAV